jgi:hypothetical protein
VSRAGQAQAGELLQLWSGALHPKNASLCATAGGNNVQIWDLRGMACTGKCCLNIEGCMKNTCATPALIAHTDILAFCGPPPIQEWYHL